MKKIKFLLLALCFIGFLGFGQLAHADEIPNLKLQLQRSSPLMKQVTLKSGESTSLQVFTMSSRFFWTCTRVTVNVVEPYDDQYFRIRNRGFTIYPHNKSTTFFSEHTYREDTGDREGFEEYTLQNLSAATITFNFGLKNALTRPNQGIPYEELLFDFPLEWKNVIN